MMLHHILAMIFGLGFVFGAIHLLSELFRRDIENASRVIQAAKIGVISWVVVLMLATSYTFYKNNSSTWIAVVISLLVQATLFLPVGLGMFVSLLAGWAWHDKLREINEKINKKR